MARYNRIADGLVDTDFRTDNTRARLSYDRSDAIGKIGFGALTEYGPLILETGITDSSIELYEWRTLVEQGKMDEARRAIALVLLYATGNPAARWTFREAWPSQYEGPRLSAVADDVAIERLVIVNEGFGRTAFGQSDEESEVDSERAGGVEEVPTGTLPRGVGVPQGIDSLVGKRRNKMQVRNKEKEET